MKEVSKNFLKEVFAQYFMQLLRDSIIEEVNKKGKITFAEFMQMALYHPKYGYYNSDREHVGRFGDFYTSPTVHRILGTHCKTTGRDVADYGRRIIHYCGDGRQ